MLSKGLIGALVLALAATGIAIAEAGGGANRPEAFKPFPQHQVAAPSKAAGGGAASKLRSFTKVKYFVSNTANVATLSEITGSLKCPRRSAAISGFFRDDKSKVVLDYSSVGGTVRKWDFGVFNFGDTTAKAQVGVVCIK